MWFAPGIGMMEFVVLLFPIFEIYEHSRRHKRLSAILSQHPHLTVAFSAKYTHRALELTLGSSGVDDLEEFAVTKDFTGENIIFLRKVTAWKKKWLVSEQNSVSGMIQAPVIRALYDTAEQIYLQSISRVHSSFPLNLEDDIYLTLAGIFCGETNATSSHIYPYHNLLDSFSPYNANQITPLAGGTNSLVPRPPPASVGPNVGSQNRSQTKWSPLGGIRRGGESTVCEGEVIPVIPTSFTVEVFDRAEKAVMGMVLMDTWIR